MEGNVKFYVGETLLFESQTKEPQVNSRIKFEDKYYKVVSVFREFKYKAFYNGIVSSNLLVTVEEEKQN